MWYVDPYFILHFLWIPSPPPCLFVTNLILNLKWPIFKKWKKATLQLVIKCSMIFLKIITTASLKVVCLRFNWVSTHNPSLGTVFHAPNMNGTLHQFRLDLHIYLVLSLRVLMFIYTFFFIFLDSCVTIIIIVIIIINDFFSFFFFIIIL